MVYRCYDSVVVEIDDKNLLVQNLRIKKRKLARARANVIPILVIENADAGRAPQYFNDLVFGGLAGVDLSDLFLRRQVAALFDSSGTAREEGGCRNRD